MSDNRISAGEPARDFAVADTQGNIVKLSGFADRKNVYLVFNRGFS